MLIWALNYFTGMFERYRRAAGARIPRNRKTDLF